MRNSREEPSLEHSRLAAVNNNCSSADPASFGRCEKRNRRADFFGPAERQLTGDEFGDPFRRR